jgi:hypothetical protein
MEVKKMRSVGRKAVWMLMASRMVTDCSSLCQVPMPWVKRGAMGGQEAWVGVGKSCRCTPEAVGECSKNSDT